MTTRPPEVQNLGRFAVSTARAQLEAFCQATGSTIAKDAVPATFPITWISEPKLGALLSGMYATLVDGQAVALHAEQSFVYVRPLKPDCSYWLDARFEGPDGSNRCRMSAQILDQGGHVMLDMTSIVALVALAPAA